MKTIQPTDLKVGELVVDVHEPLGTADILTYYVVHGVVTIETAPLATADYAWRTGGEGGSPLTVGVERKTPNDFVSSFQSGRLNDQIARLVDEYDLSVLLIDGAFNRSNRGTTGLHKFPYQTVQSTLFRVQMQGVKVVHLDGRVATLGSTLLGLYHYLYREHTWSLQRGGVKVMRGVEVPVRMLAQIPGVGVDKAKVLIEEFGDITSIMLKSTDDLQDVKGIGPKLAEAIVGAFTS